MSSLDSILSEHLSASQLEFVENLIYGGSHINDKTLSLPPEAVRLSEELDLELQGYSLVTSEDTNSGSGRVVRLGLFQNSIISPTTAPVTQQRDSLHDLAKKVLGIAHKSGVQVFCFQELWTMPMGCCTQKKLPWTEFAEDAYHGPTTLMLLELSKEYDMVIVSPILERDANEFLWNTAVVLESGEVRGIYRKNHIPISGRYSETYYYNPSDLGVPVFQTKYGRIGVSICYDRHHPQNWYFQKLNGAEIVFNPSASIAGFGDSLWGVEGRAAAAANGYYVGSINRVGAEEFGNGTVAGPFFGSSYVAGPDGERTKGISTSKTGLLVVDVTLNSCKREHYSAEVKDTLSQFVKGFSRNTTSAQKSTET